LADARAAWAALSETVQRISRHFTQLVKEVIHHSASKLSDLFMLTPPEEQRLLIDWNATGRKYDPQTITALFEEQAERTPDHTAVVCGARQMTYRELNDQAKRLAGFLSTKGVGPNAVVGLMVDRSPHMLVSMLAVLKAGGAYLPIDPQYPRYREPLCCH
jgi:non-ribosomal peptide synthetase component F